jgi:hypothetical protein
MAHGFLTPAPVSGESPISKYFERKIDELIGKGIKKLEKGVSDKFNDLFKKKKDTTYRSGRGGVEVAGGYGIGENTAVGGGMFSGREVPKMLQGSNRGIEKNPTNVDIKTGAKVDTVGGPKRLPGTAGKGSTYTNMPGVASTPTGGLNAENFFAKAQTGVGDSGEYLTKSQRVADFRKSQEMRTASANTPAISPDSGADIVAAINKNTEVIVRLSDLTNEQTKTQQSMHNEQQAHADKLSNRALARGEENALEKGSDFSSFLKAERFARLPGVGGGSGGGRGGGPGMGIGGKAATGALVQAVGKRGVERVGTRLAAKYGGKAAAKAAGKFGAKQAAKLGGSAIGKSLGKKIPLVGLGLGAVFAAQRALQGDFVGAGLELASGAASTVPGVGTVGSIGIDAALAARDMGMTPFAKGGIITQPTNALMGESGAEGVFPLEGRRGKNTFEAMGEGILEAQKKGKAEFADLQSAGLKLYFENRGGFKAFGDLFGNVMSGIFGPIIGRLSKGLGNFLGGALNNLFGLNANKNLSSVSTGGLADFIGGLESGNDYTKMVGGAQDASVLNKNIDQLMSEKGGQFAMGRYQIQMRTAAEVLKNAGIDTSSFKFDKAGQDKIFQLLLKRRGVDDFMSGKINEDQFAKNLSMEWAALPENASGKGYYDGVGTNKSLTSFSSVKGQLSALKASGSPFRAAAQTGSGGSQNLASAAQSLKGTSTADGPDGGRSGCVYAVNKVFNKAGITPPWGSSLYVPDAEKSMIDAGWQQVPYGQQQPGDVFVMKDQKSPPQAHIGVATDNKFILSNSSGKEAMSWSSTAQGYNSYYGGQGALYRMPGQQAVSTAQAKTPGTAPEPPKREDFASGRSGAKAFSAAKKKFNAASTPSPIAAAPASPQTGTPIMATSAQVARAGSTASSPTIINNYYTTSNSSGGGVNSNGVAAGIGMNDTGTAAFTELRLRTLA